MSLFENSILLGIIVKQSIKGTIFVYLGVLLGFITTAILFPRIYSPAENGLSKDDEVLTINGQPVSEDTKEWGGSQELLMLTVKRWGRVVAVSLNSNEHGNYFSDYVLVRNREASEKESVNFEKWLGGVKTKEDLLHRKG